MRSLLIFATAGLIAGASATAQTGVVEHIPTRSPPTRTVATLGTCTDGSPRLAYVTDGASSNDCAIGGATPGYEVLCRCADGAWGAGSGGTVTSVGIAVPSEWTVSDSPITGSGTITISEATQSANTVYAGPTSGGAAAPGFRALVSGDIPSLSGTYALTGAATTSGLTVATDRILGRDTAGTGAIEELSLGSGLTLSGGVLSSSGGIGGSTGASDDAILCSDGTGGATLQACNAASTLGGALRAAAGDATAPSLSFSTDTDTGLFSCGANCLGTSVGGTSYFRFEASAFRVLGFGYYVGIDNGARVSFSNPNTDIYGATDETAIGSQLRGGKAKFEHGIVFNVEGLTIADSGGAGAATSTLSTPLAYVECTCNDADGCDVTLAETSIARGQMLYLVTTSANACNLADTAGVTELAGAWAGGQYDAITLLYTADRWIELSRSDN